MKGGGGESRGRGHTSWVWKHFDGVDVTPPGWQPGQPKRFTYTCLVCKALGANDKSYSWKTGDGTGTFSRHLQNKHDLFENGPRPSGGKLPVQTQLGGYMNHLPGGGTPFIYNKDRMIDEMSTLVIANEYPFSYGENANVEHFNKVALQPAFTRVPRNTLRRYTQTSYYKYRSGLIELFRTFDGRVSFTSDTWTSSMGEPFLCITAHWVDDDWFIQKRILCFQAMEERHTGFNIKVRILDCLKEFHLNNKVFSLSLDNATANTKCIDYLKNDSELHLLLGGSLLHVRCCAHILNLSVQEGLAELQPLLNPIRTVIKWIRITQSVRRKYIAMCKERGLKKRQWSIDTPTRWNSTFNLLNDAIKYRDILTQLYNETRVDPTELLTESQWTNASFVRDVLNAFDSATHIFSYIYEPNIHLVVIECVKVVHTIEEHMKIDELRPVLDSMKRKWHTYFSEFPIIYGIAAILDPGVKAEGLENLLEFYYTSLGIDYDVSEYINKCKSVLGDLYDHYASIYGFDLATPTNTSTSDSRFGFLDKVMKKKHKASTSFSSSSSSTLAINDYLSYQHETNNSFQIIKWWQEHQKSFPILARIAKDILAVPASSVASESAFSAGRRVLDEKRSRLTPESIQICVCKKDWDQAERRTQGLKQDEDDEDDPVMILESSTDDAASGDDDATNMGG